MSKKNLITFSTIIASGAILLNSVLGISLAANATDQTTTTPIKHTIIIYQENRSYDSYFGTYPNAPGFNALPGTPKAEGIPAGSYNLDENGNKVAPFLFDPNQLTTEDVDHNFDDMVGAYDNGKMDNFYAASEKHKKGTGKVAMGYYDYQSIPYYWQYAQHYSLADHFFQPVFGPSTPGALYLISAQSGNSTNPIKGDPVPAYGPLGGDKGNRAEGLKYKNIGDVLNEKGISWAWYQGGYTKADSSYSSHHNPFQYFDNYDKGAYKNNMKDYDAFAQDVANGTLPAVVYIKGAYGEDEHPGASGQSNPTAEDFSVKTINTIMKSKYWKDSAIIVTYDESGGYWDHVAPTQVKAGPDGLQGNGPRIPAIVISPFSKENYVSNTEYDTTSILKFIESNYKLDSLNNRDKAANNILDMFDFDHPNFTPFIFQSDESKMTSSYGIPAKIQFNNAILAKGLVDENAFIDSNNNVMVPIVDLARNLNATISYDNSTQMITLKYSDHTVNLTLHSDAANIDGNAVALNGKIWDSPTNHGYISTLSLSDLPGLTVQLDDKGVTIQTK
ncbi:MAG: hypothetical protein JWM44_343 [Bacilli bacterium]|nr:hypothetical protein [Bacilli bacterium]